MKSSWSNCWSVVDPKHWTTLALCPAPFPVGVILSSSLLYLHLLQVFVSGILVAMVLHLAQMPLFRGEHGVNLWKKRMTLVKETLPGLIPQSKRQQTNTEWIPWWAMNRQKRQTEKGNGVACSGADASCPGNPLWGCSQICHCSANPANQGPTSLTKQVAMISCMGGAKGKAAFSGLH